MSAAAVFPPPPQFTGLRCSKVAAKLQQGCSVDALSSTRSNTLRPYMIPRVCMAFVHSSSLLSVAFFPHQNPHTVHSRPLLLSLSSFFPHQTRTKVHSSSLSVYLLRTKPAHSPLPPPSCSLSVPLSRTKPAHKSPLSRYWALPRRKYTCLDRPMKLRIPTVLWTLKPCQNTDAIACGPFLPSAGKKKRASRELPTVPCDDGSRSTSRD